MINCLPGLVAGRAGSFLHPHKSQQDLQAASVVAQRFRIRVHEAQRGHDVYCLSFMVSYAVAKVQTLGSLGQILDAKKSPAPPILGSGPRDVMLHCI
jgi:hypothetical protein